MYTVYGRCGQHGRCMVHTLAGASTVWERILLFATNWLWNSGKMKEYPDDIWTVRIWTVIFPGDIWTVKIWTVKTGLGLVLGLGLDLGLGLVLGFEIELGLVMTVQILTVQMKTGNHGRLWLAAPLFGPCLLSPDGWMDQDAIWYEGTSWPRPHCVR